MMKRKASSRKALLLCSARDANGKPCGNPARKGLAYCRYHMQAPEALVAIVTDVDARPGRLLEQCLELARFWEHLELARLASRKAEKNFGIVVKPDLDHFETASSRGTSPFLVEHLIGLLHRRGYTRVAVVDGPGAAGTWLDNRDVEVLADLAGYRYQTDDGGAYSVRNLAEKCVDAGFQEGRALAGAKLSRYWLEADFRICFGKNKTHEENRFALCLQTLLGVFPFQDKDYHCFGRLPAPEILGELLERTPVHFSLIDAVTSNHGGDGVRKNNPLATNTMIGSHSLILADLAGALKMGLDPYASPLNAHVLRQKGLPATYRVDGSLEPYAGWKNVPPLLADSVRKRNRSLTLRKATQPWTTSVDRTCFPFKRDLDDQINQVVAPLLSGVDDHPFKLVAAILSNYLLAEGGRMLENYRILYGKEKLYRRTTSIGLDPSRFSKSDFESIPSYIEPFEAIAASAPVDRNGLKWRTYDSSVVIEFSRILPFAFDKFVRKVDIAGAVRMMNDNIGGAVAPVLRNKKDGVLHQVERDLYLPQPNWIALFGGDFIDVTKIELVRRSRNEHAIFWRTVASLNNSARFDDGIVRFVKSSDATVTIKIICRQDFTLPLILQMFNLDLVPHVKDPLVSDAYLTYFGRTLANYEAVFLGRDVRIGSVYGETFGEAGSPTPEHLAEELFKKITAVAPIAEIIKAFMEKGPAGLKEINPMTRQAGTMASSAISLIAGIMNDLFSAVRKDLSSAVPATPAKEGA